MSRSARASSALVLLPEGCEAERRYAASVLLGDFLGLDLHFERSPRAETGVRLNGAPPVWFADHFFAQSRHCWLSPGSLPTGAIEVTQAALLDCGVAAASGCTLPHFGASRAAEPPVRCDGERSVALDLFGAAFFLLSRYEEVAAPATDAHGRQPAATTWQVRHGLVQRALVDEYVALIAALLAPGGAALPRTSSYRFALSHDVDTTSAVWRRPGREVIRSLAADLLSRRSLGLARRRARAWASGRPDDPCDPYNTFERLMAASETVGTRSAFYFIPEGADPRDATYRLNDDHAVALLRALHTRGHEIGIHPGYGTFLDPASLVRQLEVLRSRLAAAGLPQLVRGGRQHYLRWRAPDTWAAWDAAGLSYDSSVGHAELAGFRCGTCSEFPVYDVVRRRPLALREVPLVAMDVTLLDSGYMGLDEAAAIACIRQLVDVCRRFRGTFSLLWHNSSLLTPVQQRVFASACEMAAP